MLFLLLCYDTLRNPTTLNAHGSFPRVGRRFIERVITMEIRETRNEKCNYKLQLLRNGNGRMNVDGDGDMNDAGNECNAMMDRKMRLPRLMSFADSFVCFWVFFWVFAVRILLSSLSSTLYAPIS